MWGSGAGVAAWGSSCIWVFLAVLQSLDPLLLCNCLGKASLWLSPECRSSVPGRALHFHSGGLDGGPHLHMAKGSRESP